MLHLCLWLLIVSKIKCSYCQTISTNLGDVTGTTSSGVNIFSDIPYTESAPTGNLRWTPMTVKTSSYSTSPFMATSSSTCVQYGGGGVEDCLKLNIYTTDTNANYPVMVWIHGGSFTSGDGYLYNGIRFALNNMVYVSINYRLGVFGFLPLNEIYVENGLMNGGLFGIHDQIIALQWIKENIADYGGDPNSMTIFGESAGGLSVCTLLFSPIATNLFTKAIIQSGTCNGPWGAAPKIMQDYHSLSGTSLATLRSRTVVELQNVGATVAVDGYVLTDTILSITSPLNANRIMIGVTSLDTLYLSQPLQYGSPTTAYELKEYLNVYFSGTGDTLYNTVINNYYKLTDFEAYQTLNEYQILWLTMSADACLVCPSFYLLDWILSQDTAIFNGNTYLYHFLGSSAPYFLLHAGELGYVFNWGNQDATLSNIAHTAWLNFATDTSNVNLQAYINETQKTTIFGGVNTVEIISQYFNSNYRGGACKWWQTYPTSVMNNMCYQNQEVIISSTNSPQPTMSTAAPIPTTSPTCPDSCKPSQCQQYMDGAENEVMWINDECTGTCMTDINSLYCNGCTICAALSNWGTDWTVTDCNMCVGGAPPTPSPTPECVDNCRLCPPSMQNQTLYRNAICTGICVYYAPTPEYQFGFCQDPSWALGHVNATLDCRGCTQNTMTTIIPPTNDVPDICINAGITSHAGYGYNIKHCSVDIDINYCDVYQETNGDPIINPTANCKGFCEYFGLECVTSWGDPDNGCSDENGWNTWPTQYTCDGVGDPPYDNNGIGVFSPDQICRCGHPTFSPSYNPSLSPTPHPTDAPIVAGSPTKAPTMPTPLPSKNPTKIPSINPSFLPTINPTKIGDTHQPTNNPSTIPTDITPSPVIISSNNPSTSPDTAAEQCDIKWLIKIRFALKFLMNIDPNTEDTRSKIKYICKIAFYETIFSSIWKNIFCFDLFDDDLQINDGDTQLRRRQLLQNNQYEIVALFQYNKPLQDAFFDDNTKFKKKEFGEQFGNELCLLAVAEGIVDADYCEDNYNTNNADTVEVDDPVLYGDDVINDDDDGISVLLIILVIIICILVCMIGMGIIYFYVKKKKNGGRQNGVMFAETDTAIQMGHTTDNKDNAKDGILTETNALSHTMAIQRETSS